MPITGPTNFSVTPNPYTNTVTLSWSGLSFTGTSATNAALSFRYGTSSTNSNFGNWSKWHYTLLTASSGSLALPGTIDIFAGLPNVTQGYYVQFQVQGTGYNSSGPVVSTVTQRKVEYTAATAPTALSVSTAVSEGNVTLSWSGAAAGTGNPITGYEIQYSDSADNSSWGTWTALQTQNNTGTSGSLSVAPPGTRGNYRRFQVRTLVDNASYISGWFISSNSVRRNTLPTAPSVFTATPDTYIDEDITLSWSGAAAGTSAIKNYVIQKSESADNVSWTSWTNVVTVTTSATSGTTVVVPTRVPGTRTQYRIAVTDVLDVLSAYKTSNVILRVPVPYAPTILAPKAGAVTYNQNPIVLIQTQPSPGSAQAVYVNATDGNWYNSVDNSGMFSPGGSATASVKTVFVNPDTNAGNANISANVRIDQIESDFVSRSFTVAAPSFETITANLTHVKAVHITALRAAVNQVRDYYNLSAYVWGWDIVPRRTNVLYWPFHILELRAAIEGIIDVINAAVGFIYISPIVWIDIGTGRPRADVMNQIVELVKSL